MPFLGSAHWFDLLIVAVLALLVFGPKKLPEIGSAVGKTYKEFRKSIGEITEAVKLDAAKKDAPMPTATITAATLPAVSETSAETAEQVK